MRSIFITGASTGIGKVTAQYFLSKGPYQVFGSVRKITDAKRLSVELGKNFHPIIMDVTDMESIKHAYDQISNLAPNGLELLVNNAGIAISGPLKDVPINELEKQIDVNVIGILRVTNAFLPLLGASLSTPFQPGKIINIGSISGLFASPMLGPYCISKHAVETISDIYRRELSIYDIKVVCMEPGPIQSEIWDKAKVDIDRYLDTDYGAFWKRLPKVLEKNVENALPTITLAKKIYRISQKKSPKPRYIVTRGRVFSWAFVYLIPERMKDFFVRRMLRKTILRNN